MWNKKVSRNTRKNDRVEILDFEETTKYEKRKPRLKFHIKNKFRFSMACLVIIAILLTGTSLITGKNVAMVGVKKVLNGLGIYTEEVRNVEIQSDNYDEPGSWHIDKSAKWTGANKAKITFDVQSVMKADGRYKDIILVLDVSGSMFGEKLEKAISDSKELVSYLLSDSHNRVAIVTFESSSEIVSDFTNNKEVLLEKLQSLTDKNNTNYNAALQNVDTIMNGYTKESNRDVVTLFLTDGYPNEDTPNQIGTYEVLKDKYSYMTISGVQYEMGTDIIEEIKQITDSQWVADQSTLNNVLFEASVSPITYEDFIVTDYIHDDYFRIDSVDDIKVTMGTVKLEEESGLQKITWNLGNSFMTGASAKMEINAILKEQYVGSEGFYSTNKKEKIVSKLPGENERTVNSSNTPVLKNNYEVVYDVNTPEGCTLEPIDKEKHFVYQNVTKKTTELFCDGYLFKGWEVDENDEKDITKVNDDIFVMPDHNVIIRATWTKQAISKSMNGTIHRTGTLYRALEEEAEKGVYAKEYTGAHQDSMDASKSTRKIYHWYGSDDANGTAILDKNNVIFAGQCWQMIRTTDTGGVKMIYNGEAEDGKCLNTRGRHVGYNRTVYLDLASNYWYGTDYVYDATTKTFTLAGNKEQAVWDDTTFSNLIGKYTCKMTAEDGSCSTLYLVESYNTPSAAYAIPLKFNSHYSEFGTLQFNASNSSPAYAGYMYDDTYAMESVDGVLYESLSGYRMMLSSSSLATTYWYSDKIEYDSSTRKYSLVDPYQVSDASEYSSLVGKYTFKSTSQTYTSSSVYYIAGVDNTTMYYQELFSGNTVDDYSFVLGDSVTDNGDGTYTINNPKSVSLTDWYKNYADYKNKYTCGRASNSTSCSSLEYISQTGSTYYDGINAAKKILIAKGRNGLNLTDTLLIRKLELLLNPNNYSDYKYTCNTTSNVCTESTLEMIDECSETGCHYAVNHYWGSSVTWDGTNYTLVDPIEIENYNNLTNLSTHHYVCSSYGQKTCSTVVYIYHYTEDSGWMYGVTLKDGVTTVEKALENMLTENNKNSLIKNGIDAWYKKHLLNYDDYLEDTIFCNDRSMINKEQSGWNPNGGMTNVILKFKEYNTTNDLSCNNITDRFSVSNDKAKLTYKVGLPSSPEMNLLNSSSIRDTEFWYWLTSPIEFYYYYSGSSNRVVKTGGDVGKGIVSTYYGVRPTVSLKPGTEYAEGDGSMENPYLILTD